MMSILGRMNPASCLGGSLGAVHDDANGEGVADASSAGASPRGTDASGAKGKRDGSSFGCAAPCHARYQPDDDVLPPDVAARQTLRRTVPDLLQCISAPPPAVDGTMSASERRRALREFSSKRTAALGKLHDLTKKGKERNRVPLVGGADGEWDVIGVLSEALLASLEDAIPTDDAATPSNATPSVDEDRRLMCWTLNNLSVPYENKAAMALGEHAGTMLRALTGVIRSNLPEAYLCCICLLNLTFLADAIRPVAFYVPSSSGKPPYSPPRKRSLRLESRSSSGPHLDGEGRISEICALVLGNESSLLRVLERTMASNAPFLSSEVQSVQGEAVRWACGIVRNITYAGEGEGRDDGSHTEGGDGRSGGMGREGSISDDSIEEVCLLVGRTDLPRLMVKFVKDSPRTPVQWTKDSLEDICLGALCNLAKWPASREGLQRAGAVASLEKIEGLPGIHGYRARAIRCSLGALPTRFA